MSVGEYIQTGLKNQTNLRGPKFGIKGYNVQDNGEKAPLYRIQNMANCTYKSKSKGNYMDSFLKITKGVPAAKYNITSDWSKNYSTSNIGKFLKAPKVTFTANVLLENKKKPGPASYKIHTD